MWQGVLISAGGLEGSLKEKGPAKSTPIAEAGHLQTLEPSCGMKSTYLRHLIYTEQPRELPTQHLDTGWARQLGSLRPPSRSHSELWHTRDIWVTSLKVDSKRKSDQTPPNSTCIRHLVAQLSDICFRMIAKKPRCPWLGNGALGIALAWHNEALGSIHSTTEDRHACACL